MHVWALRSYPDIDDVKQSVFEFRGVFDKVHELGAHEQGVPEIKTGFTIQIHQESVAALTSLHTFLFTQESMAVQAALAAAAKALPRQNGTKVGSLEKNKYLLLWCSF